MRITVRIKPGSRKGPLVEQVEDGLLVIHVREPAVEGKANDTAIKILAEHFDIPKTYIKIISGRKSKLKRFEILSIEE